MKKIIFVSDMFADRYAGGAELTTEALIKTSPYDVEKIQSADLRESHVESNQDAFWIFGNFTDVSPALLMKFAKEKDYAVLEYDYKFCKHRNPSLHQFSISEPTCQCEKEYQGKLNSMFIHKAKAVFWMSKIQQKLQTEHFPFLDRSNNITLSSIFGDDVLDKIAGLDTSNKNDKWVILNSPSIIKGVKESINYAEENDLEYELVWRLKHDELLRKLAVSKGLLFLPLGEDTCPRIVIEAKLLDCEIITNDKVQHQKEEWFQEKETMMKYLRGRPLVFWKEIEKHV